MRVVLLANRAKRRVVEALATLRPWLAERAEIVAEPDTYNYFLRHFSAIWLKARPEEHMARVQGQGDERPMIGNPDSMADLRHILTSREVLYSNAEAEVDTSNATQNESLNSLLKVIQRQIRPPL